MDFWNNESHSYEGHPIQEYWPPYQEPVYQESETPTMHHPMSEMDMTQQRDEQIQGQSQEEQEKIKLEKRRERNRQASARYRERKEQLLAHLEGEAHMMAQEVAELEARLQSGLQELARLKKENGGYGIVIENGNIYTGL